MKLVKETTDKIQWLVIGFCLDMFTSTIISNSKIHKDIINSLALPSVQAALKH